VGTKDTYDDSGLFDTAQLVNTALTAPYLHDGRAATLEEIWTLYNPHDQHGRTNDLTKEINSTNDRGLHPGGSARPGRDQTSFTALRVAYLVHTYALRSGYD